jgi:hypothetical protein
MSSYGPHGGPYPGQPQDPWGDTPTDGYSTGYPDPLTEAGLGPRPSSSPSGHSQSSSYGQSNSYGQSSGPGVYGGTGVYGERRVPAPGSVTGEVWGPAPPAVRPGRTGPSGTAIGVIIIVVLLALAGAGIAAMFLTRDDGGSKQTGNQPGGPSGGPSTSASAPAPNTSAANADAKVAKAGDCLVNRGTPESPDMQKVTCAANTYQVLKRIDGTADRTKCEGTPGLTDWYFFDHSDNKQDFVLCLKKRS